MPGFVYLMLVALAGALLGSSIVLARMPPTHYEHRTLRLIAVFGILIGCAVWLRAVAFSFIRADFPAAGDWAYRMSVIVWTFAAAGAAIAVQVTSQRSRSGVWPILVVSVALLLAVFALSPAFPSLARTGASGAPAVAEAADLSELSIRWAFPAMVVTAFAVLAGGAVALFRLSGTPGPRITRTFTRTLAFAFSMTALLWPLVAFGDAGGLEEVWSHVTAAAIAVGWIACIVVVVQRTFAEVERNLRKLRSDLESTAANALRDPLTGLYNRGFFFEALYQAVERLKRDGEPFAVAMLDLDDFKAVNDTHGHPVGDLVLQNVAKVVMRGCRPYDTAARYGGEEFVILLRAIDRDQAVRIVERLRAGVHAATVVNGPSVVRVTATFGLVLVQQAPKTVVEIIKKVDGALYEGKRSGKNQVRVVEAQSAGARRPRDYPMDQGPPVEV